MQYQNTSALIFDMSLLESFLIAEFITATYNEALLRRDVKSEIICLDKLQ